MLGVGNGPDVLFAIFRDRCRSTQCAAVGAIHMLKLTPLVDRKPIADSGPKAFGMVLPQARHPLPRNRDGGHFATTDRVKASAIANPNRLIIGYKHRRGVIGRQTLACRERHDPVVAEKVQAFRCRDP